MNPAESRTMMPRTAAPCSLYCGVCRLYIATQANDLKLLARMARVYARVLDGVENLNTEDLLCDGCLSDRRSFFCRTCSIRDCVQGKRLDGCHSCDDFACELIDQFPIPVGKKVIMRAEPYRRTFGTETWMRAEDARYRCPDCGGNAYRGAEWCPHCRTRISLD